MRHPNLDFDTRALSLPKLKGGQLRAVRALTHQAKNLYNTALYLVRQVFTAYSYEPVSKTSQLKAELLPEQQQVIEFYNTQIAQINQNRTAKHPAQCAKALAAGKEALALRLLVPLTDNMPHLARSLLDATTLDNVARHWLNTEGVSIYKRLPGAMAQQALKKLGENFSSFFQAQLRFKANGADMTGRPRMPGYLGKHERFTLEIPLVAATAGLPSLKGKHIPEDYLETSHLTPELLEAFSAIDLNGAIASACRKRGWAEFQPQHLRMVPLRHGVKLEAVVRVKNAYPVHSFMAHLVCGHGVALAELKNEKARGEWLMSHLQSLTPAQLPRVAAIDLGVNNLAAVAYSTGHKAAVHSGDRFDDVLTSLGLQIDGHVASITPERAKVLQGLKNSLQADGKRLEKADHIELNTLLKAVFEDAEYRRLTEKKKRWSHDYLHKLSRALIQDCQTRHIDVIVIGRNIGWKQEVAIGRKQNRRFCQVAHATLISLLKYKAEAAGIAVVTTEESYTSKTSFVNGDILESFEDKVNTKSTGQVYTPACKTGKRSTSDRNKFTHKNRTDRWRVVHADVNGAFNIIRKVFTSFKYHLGLTLKYTIYRLSPRLGVVGFKAT